VLSLGELKGIAMKVGQVLSYIDDSLAAETRKLLAMLQTSSQPTAFARIEETLRRDLGPRAEPLLATMDGKPAAAASIGQVHRARLPDGTPVAVKVRHPGIESAIAADFRSARTATVLAHLLAPGSNVEEVIAEARARFLEECDYLLERRRQERFASLYGGHPLIRVPAHIPGTCSSTPVAPSPCSITAAFVNSIRAPSPRSPRCHEPYAGRCCRNPRGTSRAGSAQPRWTRIDLRNVVRDKRAALRLQVPGKLLFLFRIRFGLYAVLSRIHAEVDWQALESNLADEAPRAVLPR
jgi:hypothetical protein